MTYLVETQKGQRVPVNHVVYQALVLVHGYTHLIRQIGLEIIKKI